MLEQISASDVIVLRNWGPVSQFKNRKRMLRELNPGVKVLPLNSVGTVERAMLRPGRQPAFWFLLGIAYFTAAYLTLRMVIGAGGNLADAVVNVFLGILLQAFPFLLIGVLLSSAIQIFVSQQWLHEHFPKHLAGSLLFAALAGFCLPVCDCASVPVFRSLVRKGVPPAAAVTFLMAAPVINPVVILSTWYAFSGDVRIVLCRVGLGLLCAVLIGLTFSRAGKNGLSPAVLWVRQQRAESSPSISAIRKRSFSVLGSTLCWAPWYPPCSRPWTGHFRGGTAGMGCSFLSWC